jgi:uncharacterized protein YkwD
MSLCLALFLSMAAAGAGLSDTNFFNLTAAQFATKSQAKQEIQFHSVQTNLISAAVLHETNRRRAEAGLPPLKHHPKARQIAEIQSQIMRRRGSISHENPEVPQYETLIKRVKAAGVNPGLAAENVATAFGLRYTSGKAFYKRQERGQTIFSAKPDGPAISPHSYESFARALVDAWMDSPGHRANILLKDAEYLGVSCLGTTGKSGMPLFYCTQVFLAPMKVIRR